jgi:actin-related protein 3
MNPPEAREQMAEIMFETFNVAGLYIGVQATLALYAQICSTGGEGGMEMGADNMTGAVIDSGDGVTHVFPVCDGYVIGSCVKSIPLAGSDMTKFIADEIKNRREDLPQGSLSEIAQKIKEDHCYVAKDLMSEFQKFDEKPEGEMV